MRKKREESDGKRKGDDIAERLVRFSAGVVKLVEGWSDRGSRSHVKGQLLRSGTAPGAHYAEARSAQSPDDFIYKLAIAAKEMREALYWLNVVAAAYSDDSIAQALIDEADALTAILFQSVKTARENREE